MKDIKDLPHNVPPLMENTAKTTWQITSAVEGMLADTWSYLGRKMEEDRKCSSADSE
jgi:hypothetical protein